MNEVPNQVIAAANKDVRYFIEKLQEIGLDATIRSIEYIVNDSSDTTFDITAIAKVDYVKGEMDVSWDYFVAEDGSVKFWQAKRIHDIIDQISTDKL